MGIGMRGVGSGMWGVGCGKLEAGIGNWDVRSGKLEAGIGKWDVHPGAQPRNLAFAEKCRGGLWSPIRTLH